MRTLNYILLSLQGVACAFILLSIGSLIASPIRNPEGGLMLVLVGFPIAVASPLVLGWLYAMRSALPDEHRKRILLASTVLTLLTVLPVAVGFLTEV